MGRYIVNIERYMNGQMHCATISEIEHDDNQEYRAQVIHAAEDNTQKVLGLQQETEFLLDKDSRFVLPNISADEQQMWLEVLGDFSKRKPGQYEISDFLNIPTSICSFEDIKKVVSMSAESRNQLAAAALEKEATTTQVNSMSLFDKGTQTREASQASAFECKQ
jgi:hypothetical protein